MCKTFSCKKFKLALGCNVAYCIPTRNQCSIGLPAGFCMPLLDASNMTDEVRELVEDQSLKGALTTREWELFIPQALMKVEFEQRGLGPNAIPEEKSQEEDEGYEAEDMDDLMPLNIQSLLFKWDDPITVPDPAVKQGDESEVLQDKGSFAKRCRCWVMHYRKLEIKLTKTLWTSSIILGCPSGIR